MNHYSSSNRSHPDSGRDAYDRASIYRSRRPKSASQVTAFNPFEGGFGAGQFDYGESKRRFLADAARDAEDNLQSIQHGYDLENQSRAFKTQEESYKLAKQAADKARQSQTRKGILSGVGQVVGGIVGGALGPGGSAAGALLGGTILGA